VVSLGGERVGSHPAGSSRGIVGPLGSRSVGKRLVVRGERWVLSETSEG